MKTNWYGNQYVSSTFIKAKKGLSTTFKGYVSVAAACTLVYVVALLGAVYLKTPVEAEVKPVVATSTPEMIPPVMQRILKCESSASQKNAKNGQIIYHINTDGTIDLGQAQINSIWFSTATKLGLDLTKEVDNKKFAIWLFENKGTEPWYSSAKCWSK